MQDTAYELLSMGMRYFFILLLLFLLFRAFGLMRRDSRAWRRTLRQLPDAGLVGELVDLSEGRGYPLPREGVIGSGRSCDIRLPGLKRRELEFIFRPGQGMRLISLHSRNPALLDGERLFRGNDFALHGTMLELRGLTCRFRLFAGLDLPARQPAQKAAETQEAISLNEPGVEYAPQPLPPSVPPENGMDMTWQYAPLPQMDMNPPEDDPEPAPGRRRRRSRSDRDGI